MLITRLRIPLYLLMLAVIPAAQAQEGHPLVGTWLGTWGENDTFLTVIMNWDGQRISGIVNPGPQASEIESASLDSSGWQVELHTLMPDDNGNSADFILEGQLANITSRTRSLDGRFRYAGQRGNFTLTRQSGP